MPSGKNTGALHFPACLTNSYSFYFQSLAANLNAHALNRCKLELPEPPPGEDLDLNNVSIVCSPGDIGVPQQLTRVDLPQMCGPASFYIDLDTSLVHLCEQSCAAVKADSGAQLQFMIQCS